MTYKATYILVIYQLTNTCYSILALYHKQQNEPRTKDWHISYFLLTGLSPVSHNVCTGNLDSVYKNI